MLFQINSMWQLLGWVLVFAGLVILNEIERRTKLGGYGIFVGVLAILTVYFIAIQISAANGGWVQPMIPMYIWVAGSIMQSYMQQHLDASVSCS